MPVYLRHIIARMNAILGEATPLNDQAAFVNQVVSIAAEDANTMAQIRNNPREVALKGNIRGAVQAAVVRAMQSHTELAEHVLQNDQRAMPALALLIYDLLQELGRQKLATIT